MADRELLEKTIQIPDTLKDRVSVIIGSGAPP